MEYKGVGKSSDNKYVLIFQAKNVDDPLPPPLAHLHGDIKMLHITTEGGSSSDYTVTGINFTAKKIDWESGSPFLANATQLVAGEYEGATPLFPAPTDKWLIYFKTDVEVSPSSALKTYEAWLSDGAGLVSNEVQGSTCIRKIGEIKVLENFPKQGGTGSNTTPYLINCVEDSVNLEVWCETPAESVKIWYGIKNLETNRESSGEGTASPTNPLKTIRLPAPAGVGNTIDYKVQFNANKTPGFAPNAKIVYYRLKRAEVIGSSLSSPTAKWQALKDALGNASAGDVFFIEGEYTMPVGSDTMVPAANCTIRGTNNAVLNADNKGKMISVISPGLQNMTLENLTIKNGKDDEFALSASWGFEFYLKNVTVEDTKKIIESNSGDVIFENVKAHDTDSIIELGGLGHTNGNILYSYLTLQGDTDIKGTVKLIFPYIGVNYSGAIKICDKKAYTLKLDFDGYYNDAVNKQVVFLDDSVTGFSLAQAVRNITVKPNGSDKYYINNSGYLKKR